jgi:hypothetical protein
MPPDPLVLRKKKLPICFVCKGVSTSVHRELHRAPRARAA